jgi:hypothetical protein
MNQKIATFHPAHPRGQSTVEMALLFPILFLLFLGSAQLIIYIQSASATQYAAFVAARAFQVYGDRPLSDIGYRKTGSTPRTSSDQSIAEAAAEMVIFESLMWEQSQIELLSQNEIFDRVYVDGIDESYSTSPSNASGGSVKINFLCSEPGGCPNGQGVTVTYCAPFVFPGTDLLFAAAEKENPCTVQRYGKSYKGLALSYTNTDLGRQPVQP